MLIGECTRDERAPTDTACYRILERAGATGDDTEGLERWRWVVEYEGANARVEVLILMAIGHGSSTGWVCSPTCCLGRIWSGLADRCPRNDGVRWWHDLSKIGVLPRKQVFLISRAPCNFVCWVRAALMRAASNFFGLKDGEDGKSCSGMKPDQIEMDKI